MIKFSGKDVLQIKSTREKTAEGYLKATSAITCTGVQYYNGRQFGRDSDDMVGVYRPADTVFHPDTMDSAKLKPITREHPDVDVTAKNYKELTVGTLGETVEPIGGGRLGAKVIITDEEIIKQVEAGTAETSAGYVANLIEKSGTYDGLEYEYEFDGPMVINHLAIVDRGRCGPSVKILDEGKNMDKKELLKFLTDAGIIDADGKRISDGMDMESMMGMMMKMMSEMMMKMMGDRGMYDAEEGEKPEAETETPAEAEEQEEADSDESKVEDSIDDKDAAKLRSKIIADTASLVDSDNVHNLENRQILEEALKDSVTDIADKSDEYLMGVLDSVVADRKLAADNKALIGNASANFSDTGEAPRVLNALDARKLEK